MSLHLGGAGAIGKHIIVVEDDDALRYSYCRLLETNGYAAHPFPTTAE